MQSRKSAYLLLSQGTTDSLFDKYKKLYHGTKSNGDVFVLYYNNGPYRERAIRTAKSISFRPRISKRSYLPIGYSLVSGNDYFPLIDFYIAYPQYHYYWCIDEAVGFTGSWGVFFDAFCSVDAGFITSHLRTPFEEPKWPWWTSLANPYDIIPLEKRLRSFNPICRMSNLALQYIHRALLMCWCGHQEVLLPTLLQKGGFKLIDFGGRGRFVPKGWTDRYYIVSKSDAFGNLLDGTMRTRWIFNCDRGTKDKLYYPIQP